MTGTQLFWQRPTPLATFDTANGDKGNVIFVSTKQGIADALDDIHDDVRNGEVPVYVITCVNTYEVTVATWGQDGTEVTAKYTSLIDALEGARKHTSGVAGSVFIVDTNDSVLDSYTRGVVSTMMDEDAVHLVLAVTVAGIETISDFLSLTRLVIDVNDKTEVALV
jgi:hypothetical protein